ATGTATPTGTTTATATATGTPNACLNYVTATATATIEAGTVLVAGSQTDDGTSSISLPFPVQFYGSTYATANVSTNGNLQFSSSSTQWTNAVLPYATFNNAVLPFWDDLDLSTGAAATSGIFTSTTGVAPNRVFNIEWRGCIY